MGTYWVGYGYLLGTHENVSSFICILRRVLSKTHPKTKMSLKTYMILQKTLDRTLRRV